MEQGNAKRSLIDDYLRMLVDDRPARRRSPGVAGYLAKQGIGVRESDPGWIRYRGADFEKAAELLRSRINEPVADAQRRPVPSALLVRAALLNSSFLFPPGTRHCTIPMLDLLRTGFEVVVVCETEEQLGTVGEMDFVQQRVQGRLAAVIVAADLQPASAGADSLLELTDAPTLTAMGLTTEALVLASELPRLEGVCAPPLHVIEEAFQRAHGEPARRPRRHSRLDAVTSPSIAVLWNALSRYAAGLTLDELAAAAGHRHGRPSREGRSEQPPGESLVLPA